MVKHIVIWKLKEEAAGGSKAQNALIMKERLEALNGQIDGLIHLEVGINFLPGNYDVVLYSTMESRNTLDFYQNHPKHQALLPIIKEFVEDRKAIDYEI